MKPRECPYCHRIEREDGPPPPPPPPPPVEVRREGGWGWVLIPLLAVVNNGLMLWVGATYL